MLEQAGMSSQHGGQGLPFLATAGSAVTGFKPNVKLQGTAHRHNHQDQIHAKPHLEEQHLCVGTDVLQNCLYNLNNCMKVGHMAFFSRTALAFYIDQSLKKKSQTEKSVEKNSNPSLDWTL